jgi:hypothetical protein
LTRRRCERQTHAQYENVRDIEIERKRERERGRKKERERN